MSKRAMRTHFRHLRLKKFPNDIKNATSHWILTLEITLWSFGSPLGLHLPKWELPWECEGSFPRTPSHFLTLLGVCDVARELLLGPHPCGFFALTLGLLLDLTLGLTFALTPELPLGLQPYNPFALVANPKLRLRQCVYKQKIVICNVDQN
jgi:hypothetical protein